MRLLQSRLSLRWGAIVLGWRWSLTSIVLWYMMRIKMLQFVHRINSCTKLRKVV